MQQRETLPRPFVTVRAWSLPRVRLSEARVTLLIAAVAYLGVATYSVFGLGIITLDAWSRVGNAFYVLFSRDPHLAAIGFVWNPLPSLLMLPLLPFKALWPELVTHGFAASIVSALFMASSVVQVRGILSDFGLRRPLRIVLTILFAIQPMILLYAANGMSEAIFLFFLLVTARYLMRWLDSRSSTALAVAGIALALAYWTRYETVAAALGVVGLVMAWSYVRTSGTRNERRLAAAADGLVVGLPFAAAFVLWALASWLIVGSAFETFTSVYGNSSQVSFASGWLRDVTGQGTNSAARYVLDQLNGLAPNLLALIGMASVLAVWRRDPRILAIVAVMGGVLLFAMWAFLTERSFGWLRFYIAVMPMVVLLSGVALSTQRAGWVPYAAVRIRIPVWSATLTGLSAQVALAAVVFVLLVAGIGASVQTMLDARLAREEAYPMQGWLTGLDQRETQPVQMQLAGGAVARYLDGLSSPDGSVLVDVATGFPVVLQSDRPRQFVMTPDRDFPASLNDPGAFGVRYLLVLANSPLDAVSRAHGLANSADSAIADLVKEFQEGPFIWRLFAIRDPVIEAAAD